MKDHYSNLILVVLVAIPAIAFAQSSVGTMVTMEPDKSTIAGGAKAEVGPTNSANWDAENNYWRGNYSNRPYYVTNRDYAAYEPAYRYGVETYNKNAGKRYEDLDTGKLRSGWDSARGNSNLQWNDAEAATRDAYSRVYNNRGNMTTSTTVNTGAPNQTTR